MRLSVLKAFREEALKHSENDDGRLEFLRGKYTE
jgi:hypothetical protein